MMDEPFFCLYFRQKSSFFSLLILFARNTREARMRNFRRVARTELQREQQHRRRYPYDESTRLVELVDRDHRGDMVELITRLQPYLMQRTGSPYLVARLEFSDETLATHRFRVYQEIAQFMRKVVADGGLKCSQSAFYRYLVDPAHSNLAISESGLKSLVARAI